MDGFADTARGVDRLPAPSREADHFRAAVVTGRFLERSQANKFCDGFGSCLLGNVHAAGQFGNGAPGFDQVLDDVAVALAEVFETCSSHLGHDELVDAQSQEEGKVA